MTFEELGLSPSIVEALSAQGYTIPTPIQAQAIPAVSSGRDVMAAAQTGTGKTAAFTLPILERLSKGVQAKNNQVRALVLTPTRELAAQVGESVSVYGARLPLKSQVVFGGVKINPQMMRLRRGADILVATPGRLLDLYKQNAIQFKSLEVLVLDEADRMLDMGFIHDIRRILQVLPKERQNLLFSATFSEGIRKLAKGLIHDPVEISVTPRNAAAKSVKQWLCPVDKRKKALVLRKLILDHNWSQVLVFSRTKHGANKLARFLETSDISAAAIHGNKSQNARTKALSDFKNGAVRVLVATDIAARGLDIDELPVVINHDLPNVAEDYVHRIGRTGRAGASGEAVSLVSADEFEQLQDIEKLTRALIQREYVDGYEPVHELPESKLNLAPAKRSHPKKPKTPGSEHRDGQKAPKRGAKTAETRGQKQRRRSPGAGGGNGPSKPAARKSQGNEARVVKQKSRNHAPKSVQKAAK